MPDSWTVLQLFPENGLDRSLHAPVYIGLLFLVFFRETLGWGFAGLVVPGYLATVLLAAPVTGGLVVVEAILTYVTALLLGRVLPRTGAWFTFFGRERFLLLIASASLVRLAIEGSLLPAIIERWNLTHSRELYSLGLVLVPLLANSFWNAGFVRAFPRVSLVTILTYLIVAEILLPYTNFTLSRFQVANESVSLAFLESPHAHIILLVGAILGARNNVRYGWDYNGILVPALLAVAWYQPSKVATTLLEGLLVYYVSMWLIRRRPFSRMMFVGCRRIVLTFSVGFAIKYLSGMLLVRWLPHVQLIDFFGFGYLLPSLLANKMWDKGGVPKVLMPTLQVSIVAFPIGTIIGFGLRSTETAQAALGPVAPVEAAVSVPWALMLGDSAPSPHRTGTTLKLNDAYALAEEVALRSVAGTLDEAALRLAQRGRLRVEQPPNRDWTVITPDAHDANVEIAGPRLAVRSATRYGDDWLVVVVAPPVGSPSIPIAFEVAERIGARAIVLSSRVPIIADRDELFGQELSLELGMTHVVRISLSDTAGDIELGAVGQLPAGLSPSLFQEVLGQSVRLEWQAQASTGDPSSPTLRLSLPRDRAEAIAGRMLGGPELDSWAFANQAELTRRVTDLTFSIASDFRVPSIPQLRLYGILLGERFGARVDPSVWQRTLAAGLGLRFASVAAPFDGWALYEPEGPERRGHPTLLQRRSGRSTRPALALTLAAPRWEGGAVAAAVRLHDAFEADMLLVHGALVGLMEDGSSDPRRPQGRQSYFQRAHETWLNAGGTGIILRGIAPSHVVSTDAVVMFDSEVNGISDGPVWASPLLAQLERAGVTLAAVDGSAERAGFEASGDPGLAYARRFAAGRTLVLWLGSELREAWRLAYTDPATLRRLESAGFTSTPSTPADFVSGLAACGPGNPCPAAGSACKRLPALASLERFVSSQNPYFLEAALAEAKGCGWLALESAVTETTWLALPPDHAGSASAADGQRHWLMVPLLRAREDSSAQRLGRRQVTRQQFGELHRLALTPLEIGLQ
jgi:hypothetical protein